MKIEDLRQFEVAGTDDVGDPSVSLTCLRCVGFTIWINVAAGEEGVGPTLADLEERADEHVEICPAVYRGGPP